MKELKFKFWNNNIKKHLDQFICSVDGNGHIDVGGDAMINVIPRQYAGRKDTLGNDIYVGDIIEIDLKRSYGHQKDGVTVVGKVELSTITIRDDSLYVFEAFNINGRSISHLCSMGARVIGNEWENPELLKRDA